MLLGGNTLPSIPFRQFAGVLPVTTPAVTEPVDHHTFWKPGHLYYTGRTPDLRVQTTDLPLLKLRNTGTRNSNSSLLATDFLLFVP